MKIFLLKNSLPNWIILLIDQVIASWSFALSYFLIWQFEFNQILKGHFLIFICLYGVVSVGIFYFMRLHTGLIRYSSMVDIYRIFVAVLSSSVLYGAVVALAVAPIYNIESNNIYLVLLVNFFISSSLLIMLRIGTKSLFFFVKRNTKDKKECVLIYGANSSSILVKEALESSGMGKFVIAGFIDEDRSKGNKSIHQIRIYHTSEIEKLHRKAQVNKLIMMSEDLQAGARKQLIDKCLELNIKVLTVPPTAQWMSGQLKLNQLKNLKIEDLLQRPMINLENLKVANDLKGKRVLVTGGAGSIGSEIVRQVLSCGPEMVVICDQAESPLHQMQLEMEEKFPSVEIKICIGDIRDFDRMYKLFKAYSPQVVYHAAAYKHVPMMENNPSEAILTNILGTKNLADLAISCDVEKFVMLSTDKAVNPTNVMGASKRIAEIYIQSLNSVNLIDADMRGLNAATMPKTKFITTRFGNVLGSNGSVIPHFRAQLEKGGPITVTHPEITRYFMTIPEAVQLVLEAGTMGNGGEIFVFDMGQPVKIIDLAHKMVKLAGLTPGVDIEIVFSGLRPGEKLYEELLNKEELTIPTHHHKIKISKVRKYKYAQVELDVKELLSLNKSNDDYRFVKKMKEMVPEYISKNSRFEELDAAMHYKGL
ncbi:polysaccharide biosynthesis protein [Pontibacter sp. E15-1]|uniref:polysaccharide biosynthesis protein n=1 Tax=Pontibacter sp. E15-1 TaxID=2919918 RepID=UPI001F4F5DEF|nr:nucleoside-diphosphate sugar epimerase/dehydratase [Pontibacter sp. E15-1]MCJ8164446.1 polysaccharide biosynthesis protein [Pontibacter sp. E15-1]